MPGRKNKHENRPTYKKKEQAVRHGHIQYGEDRKGRRKFRLWRTKHGWSVAPKSPR